MEYRILGKTGLKVSALGYGGSALGGVFGNFDEGEGIRSVHAAVDAGVNFIDVSPYYGLTKAETVLGKALRDIPRDAYTLATKVGCYSDTDYDYSAARVTAEFDESLRRLGVGYVDLLQCHDIEYGSLDQVVNETIPALRKLQEQGKVRFIGITGLPLTIFPYVIERTEVDTVLSFCRYCLNDTGLERLIPDLKARNIGIINASALAMGLLTNQGPPAWHPAPDAIKAACAQAAAYCLSKGADISTLALQFSLANTDIATTLVSMPSAELVAKNVDALNTVIDQDLLAEVQVILQPIKNVFWTRGRPENHEVEHPV
jgi:L-galactose dehydrogenase